MKEIEKKINEKFIKEREVKNYTIRMSNEFELIHMIEEGKDDYAISAKIIIPKNSKMMKKCLENNKSPITQALEKIEKEHRQLLKEEKTNNSLYWD